jgi:general secretion pathway protein A
VYREHFELKERPFTHSPGQRFFTANAGMTDALGRLQHVLTARDAVAVVTGGPGVGKSAIAECAAASVPDGVRLARVDLRYGDAEDLYASILLSLGEDAAGMRPVQALYALRQVMRRLGGEERRLALLLDIAGISAEVARHLLRVMNLAGEQGCQLNLLLMGPHPLHQQVDVPAMILLRQRIAFRHRVRPLTLVETDRYVRHQLEAVGADASAIMSSNVAAAVYCYVAGVPRLINTLLDAALSDAALQKLTRPDGGIIKRTAEGLGWKPMTPVQPGPEPAARAPAPRPAAPPPAPRSAPPKVALVASGVPERRGNPRGGTPADARPADQPPPSEMTLQLRADAAIESTRGEPVSLASDAKSPTAAVFGGAPAAAPPVPMDEQDTGATGMLRLQDLDERFAETIFGKEAADADK